MSEVLSCIIKCGYVCNNNCFFCHARDKKGNVVDLDEIRKKVDLASQLGVKRILLSGGEVSIRSDFFDILDYIKNCGLGIGLISNGRMFALDDFVLRLKDYPIEYVFVSLHGHNAGSHDEITGVKGAFLQTVKGLQNILKVTSNVIVNVVVTKKNVLFLKKMVVLLDKLRVPRVKFSVMEPVSKGDFAAFVNTDVCAREIKSVIDYAKEECFDIFVGFDGLPLCSMFGYEESLVNLETENIKYISEGYERDFSLSDCGNKTKFEICEGCCLSKFCEGVYVNELKVNPLIKNYISEKALRIRNTNVSCEASLMLFVSYKCPLRCSYCAFNSSGKLMSLGTAKKGLDFVFNTSKDIVKVHMYGGEPFSVSYDFFESVIGYGLELAAKFDKSVKFVVTTNGLLIDEKFVSILERNKDIFMLNVSLDGSRFTQDLNRKTKGGISSYEIVRNHIVLLQERGIKFKASSTISPKSSCNLFEDFVHIVDECGIRDVWISFAHGVFWDDKSIDNLEKGFSKIFERYVDEIRSGDVNIVNLGLEEYLLSVNNELILDVDEKLYPYFSFFLDDKGVYSNGDLNDLKGDFDYYEKLKFPKSFSAHKMYKGDNVLFENNKKVMNVLKEIFEKFKAGEFIEA